jgi:hypothetical protein
LEPIAKIVVVLLEAFPVTGAIAEGISDDEPEGGRQQHPHR